MKFNASLQENIQALQAKFSNCEDFIVREILIGDATAAICFLDGIVDSKELESSLLMPLLSPGAHHHEIAVHMKKLVPMANGKQVSTIEQGIEQILNGYALLIVDGMDFGMTYSVSGGEKRSVQEPSTEAVVRGPREGFTESIVTNTTMLRKKIKTSDLKMIHFKIGERSNTTVILAYLETLADSELINVVTQRLKAIRIDAILESGYIEECIEDHPMSPFPQLQYSERPDTIAAQLLEGRFAIFVDGTPFVLTAPVTAWQMLQASEDYYERHLFSTPIRWLRLIFLFIALFLPSLYIAITTFHQEMLPTTLVLSIATAREAIPFPALVEALIMEVSFEALREAGVRLPKTVGQAVSILGALVIGQAAVQAGIVSAPMVIIVSLTGIASFTIPRFNFALGIRLLRFPIMVVSGLFGLFGMVLFTTLITSHMCRLTSFGVPYLAGVAPNKNTKMSDILQRASWRNLSQRPSFIQQKDLKRFESQSTKPPKGW